MNPNRGMTFVRAVKALGVARGDLAGAMAYAQSQRWHNAGDVTESLRLLAVSPMGTSDLAPATPAAFDFAEFIRPMTILGKLTALRRVPFRVRMLTAESGTTAYWAGEAGTRPVSAMSFSGSTLEQLEVVAIAVATDELVMSSTPHAESIFGRDLAKAAAQAMDEAFIDPDNAGEANVKPAAITHGEATISSSGSSLAQIDSDLDFLINSLSEAGSTLEFATWVMTPRTATYLARLRGTGGSLAYPGMTVRGGSLLGLPAITSASVPALGSPIASSITLLDASQIELADEGVSTFAVSKNGALQMQSAPGDAATEIVSMWQGDSQAFRMGRFVNWRRCRSGIARVLSSVGY